ncbi:MAG TPA: isocitrate dehydrogenase (NAD(+)) [Thermoanaerobaculia bacterium]|nr:isocitrate dehydrogenase (NAD(+)) [Thermoanaerobaculia bacterium]
MAHKITLLPGDGIGPEVTAAVVSILECTGVEIEWEKYSVGSEALSLFGDPLPQEVLDSILRNKVALKGPVTTPVGTGFQSINVRLRKTLDLYANLRPVKSMLNIKTRYEDVDLVVVRENTESLYAGLEHEVVPGVVESLKIITERASTRIARFAFEYARTHGRKRITAVHKANIMKLSDGLFLKCFREVAKEYPNIVSDDRIVDNLCMQLVMNPNQFDTLLLENLYGDIVSDLAAGLVGGLGVVGGANIGENGAVFEAVHGSAPDIAGQNKANPLALLQSAVMMLQHIGEVDAARRIYDAIVKILGGDPENRTRDIGGTGHTTDFTAALCGTLRKGTRKTD